MIYDMIYLVKRFRSSKGSILQKTEGQTHQQCQYMSQLLQLRGKPYFKDSWYLALCTNASHGKSSGDFQTLH